jgi:pilus assembly protein CpaC
MNKLMMAAFLGLGIVCAAGVSPEAHAQDVPRTQWLDVEVGQSSIQKSSRPFARVLISDPDVAEIKLLEEGQFSIRGVSVGSTDLWVWYRDDPEHPEVFELSVHRDLSDLVRRVAEIAPGDSSPPRIYPMEDRIVVEGAVSDLITLERIAAVSEVYDPEFVNLMSVRGDHQVQLEVVFAEVSRTAMREMGLSFMGNNEVVNAGLVSSGASGDRGYVTSNDARYNQIQMGELVNEGFTQTVGTGGFALMGALVSDAIDMQAALSVLEQHGITKILAEPKIVALSGQQAEFLAGGEVPIPVSQSNNGITLDFKEYGVKLVFVPTVLGDEVIDMRTYVEVSEIDSATSTRITGIEIPGFVSRKAESHLRMSNGMTFAMAGMLSESTRYTKAQIPILGDIPILGAAFRYTKHERDETELIIFVTPRLVRPMAPGEVPVYPGETEDNNPNDFELFLLGMDHGAGSRTAEPTGNHGMER